VAKGDKTGKAHLPWSIKGVGTDAREIAKASAAEDGGTIGNWLTGVVQRVGATEASGKTSEPPAVPKPVEPEQSEAGSRPAADHELVDMVAERIEATEDRMVAVVTSLNEIVTALSARLERLEQTRPAADAASGEAGPSTIASFRADTGAGSGADTGAGSGDPDANSGVSRPPIGGRGNQDRTSGEDGW